MRPRWPADSPLCTDARLAGHADAAGLLCRGGRLVRVLKHVPGRRLAALVSLPDGLAVLKVFASPRARGNDRRLRLLAPAVGGLVPRPLAVDPAGHVGLVSWADGTPLDRLSGDGLVAGCALLGAALGRLHRSGVVLDRAWTVETEVRALRERATPATAAAVEAAVATSCPRPDRLVPSHRDLHPAQVVVAGSAVSLIDLDEAAMAPAGLDVGNLVGHLRQDAVLGRRPAGEVDAATAALLGAYGPVPADTDRWTSLTLARLAGLADARHGRADWSERLLACLA